MGRGGIKIFFTAKTPSKTREEGGLGWGIFPVFNLGGLGVLAVKIEW
jgi:hypothetical protein